MKIKQVTDLLVRVKNRFASTQSPETKQATGLTVQSGLKAGASEDLYQPYIMVYGTTDSVYKQPQNESLLLAEE